LEVGYSINADYDLNDDLASDLLRINKGGGENLGQTPLFCDPALVNMKPTPAQLDMNLKATNVSIAEISRLTAAAGIALAPGDYGERPL